MIPPPARGQRMIRGYSGKQPGDPVRAAAAIVKAVEAPDAPLRLMLGKAALAAGRGKVEALSQDFECLGGRQRRRRFSRRLSPVAIRTAAGRTRRSTGRVPRFPRAA